MHVSAARIVVFKAEYTSKPRFAGFKQVGQDGYTRTVQVYHSQHSTSSNCDTPDPADIVAGMP